jgi:23S rRNA pseudouridine2605 synthase
VFESPVLGAYCHEKDYKVLVARRPDDKRMTAWRTGVVLEDGYRTKPAKVKFLRSHGKGAWLLVTLTEGRKRQIREMGRLTGLPVVQIIRVRIGSLELGKLRQGQWRHLTEAEVDALKTGAQTLRESPGKSAGKVLNEGPSISFIVRFFLPIRFPF